VSLHLALACDARYAPHAAAMIESVMRHGDPARWSFHLLHGPTLDAPTRERLRAPVAARGATLHCHAVDDARVATLAQMDRIGSVMWYRVFLPELLPDAARVLYVDCDTLAATDLAPLLASNLGGKALGAVRNVFDRGQEDHAERIGLPRRDYFNSGVLLYDLDAWRRDGIGAQVLKLARERAAQLIWPDQDALNWALAGNWTPLPPRWNAMNSLYYFDSLAGAFSEDERRAALETPGIVHFEGPGFCKPWHLLCKHPLRDEYLSCRGATSWPEVAIEGRSARNQLLRLLPMRRIPQALNLLERVDRRWRRLGGMP
jgi:lipopolysaccharide biosynthesis glycosyltransferase